MKIINDVIDKMILDATTKASRSDLSPPVGNSEVKDVYVVLQNNVRGLDITPTQAHFFGDVYFVD